MQDFDPMELSRTLGRAEDVAWAWQDRLPELASPEDLPLLEFRSVLTQQYHAELAAELPKSDALRPALLRWISHLLELRVNGALTTELARLRFHDVHSLEAPERTTATLASIARKVLRDERRRIWLTTLAERSRPTADLIVRQWQRRAEVYLRLGGPSLDEVELPCSELYTIASEVIDWTQPLVADCPGLSSSLEAVTKATTLTFPANLNSRTLADWFRETRLLEAVKLRTFTWPEPVAPASFCLALHRFGAVWRRGLAPRNQPFVVAVDALGLEEQTMGWLFANLPSNLGFARRHLETSSDKQRDVNRYWGRLGVHEIRLRAVRLLTRQALLTDFRERPKMLEQLGERVWGEPMDARLTGVLPQLAYNDGQRLCAVGLGASLADALTEAHNDDWYRNPRAVDELRANAARPPELETSPDVVRRGLRRYVDQLTAWLG